MKPYSCVIVIEMEAQVEDGCSPTHESPHNEIKTTVCSWVRTRLVEAGAQDGYLFITEPACHTQSCSLVLYTHYA